MNRAEKIKKLCEEKKLSVSEVLRHAGVSSTILFHWEKEDPKTFRMYDSIMSSIEHLSTQSTEVTE